MSKTAKLVLIIVAVCLVVGGVVLALTLPKGNDTPTTKPSTSTTTNGTPSTQSKTPITGVSLSDKTVTYNGQEHTLVVTGDLPDGVTVVYNNNKATNAGEYQVTAQLSGEGYEPLELTAKLTVSPAPITGILFENGTVEYDALPHSIYIMGDVPAGVTVNYTYNGQDVDEVVNAGKYEVKATLSGPNHKTLVLTATLNITATEELLFSYVWNDKVYFQNPLDSNALYVFDGTGISRVNGDQAQYFTDDGTNLYYSANALFGSSIREFTSSSATSLYKASAEYLVCDGEYVYYAVNQLINYNDQNGIYRFALEGDADRVAERLTTDKGSWLVLHGNYVYYANGKDSGALKRVPKTGGTSAVVYEDNVTEMIIDGNTLYFTRDGLINDAIYRMTLPSGEAVQMTIDAGRYLTVIGNNLYYVNCDILTGKFFGEGIYKISTTSASAVASGTLLLDGSFSSLRSDGNSLYYYKVNDKHFYEYDIASEEETDLMEGFVPVDNSVISHFYLQITEHNGELYFINAKDGGSLYKYNPNTKATYKVLPDAISNFYFHGDYLYYSTYVLTNYAFWRVNLSNIHDAKKLTSDRVDQVVFDGDYIYYLNVGATKVTLWKMKQDGTENAQLDKTGLHIQSLEKVGNMLYMILDPAVGYKKVATYDLSGGTFATTDINGEMVCALGNTLYIYDQKNKQLLAYNTQNSTHQVVANNCEITDMVIWNGHLYYANAKTNYVGLYKFDGQNATKVYDGNVTALSATSKGLCFIKAKVTWAANYPLFGETDMTIYAWNGTAVVEP